MAIRKVIWCDECGRTFDNVESAHTHEQSNCIPWSEGNWVMFRYFSEVQGRIIETTGKITKWSDRINNPGMVRTFGIRPFGDSWGTSHSDVKVTDIICAVPGPC